MPHCAKCKGKLKVYGERRRPTFSCEACGWTSDRQFNRARQRIQRGSGT